VSKSLKNIGVVASATVASRLLGLVREIFIAAAFGTGALNSAFVWAFTLPNLFRRLLGEGALTAAFIPTMTHELEHRQRAAAFGLVSKVASWLFLVTVGLVGAAMLVLANANTLFPLLGGDMSTGTLQRLLLGAHLGVILFPYMVFVCLAAVFSAACQVLGRFTEPALSPIWLNLVILAALGVGWWLAGPDLARMHLLCAGVLLGGFLQMAVPAGVLLREGWRPAFDVRTDDRVREILRLMGPTVIGSAIYLINVSLSRFIGLSLNDHAASALNLATRVMELPIGVFAIAITTVVFPLIARHAAKGDWVQLGRDYHKGLRLVLVINIPAAAGLALLSEPIIRLLFERGAFQAKDTALMTPVLAVYALGLPFLAFTTVALRGFYSLKDTATPVRAAAISFVVNLGLSLLLMRWLSTVGLALASNIAVLVQALCLQAWLARRRPELGFGPVVPSLFKILFATLVMTAAIWAGQELAARIDLPSKLRDLVLVGTLIPVGIVLYGGLLWALRIEGRDDLALVLQRIRGKIGL
jgi:putative peptidoglycan lipid II flippase